MSGPAERQAAGVRADEKHYRYRQRQNLPPDAGLGRTARHICIRRRPPSPRYPPLNQARPRGIPGRQIQLHRSRRAVSAGKLSRKRGLFDEKCPTPCRQISSAGFPQTPQRK